MAFLDGIGFSFYFEYMYIFKKINDEIIALPAVYEIIALPAVFFQCYVLYCPWKCNVGFVIQLMEETCEHFAVVDQKIVWYGNMNFLSKEDIENNIMRVLSKYIAVEIMEMTFGGQKELMEW